MNFNDVFEEYLELYTEGKEKGLDGKACWDGYELRGTKKKDGKTVDNCVKSDEEVEDCESCGCSDEEVEDCETCGCEENPEYGHFNDTYSNYIDQYEEPAEDAEYDMGEVFDTIADDIKAGMSKAELEAEHGTAAVRKFMEYTIFDRRGRPTAKTNPRPHVNRKVVNNIKNTKGPDPIEDEDAEEGETFETYLKDIFAQQYDSDPEQFENFIDDIHDALGQQKEYDLGKGSGLTEPLEWRMEMGMDLDTAIEDAQASLASLTVSDVVTGEEDAEKIDKDRMKCNKPRRTSGGSKKFVVKACKDGKEKIVRFGDPNMKIKKSNPKRRKSFRARHKCDQKKDKFSAGYWSCKKW